MNLGQIYDAIKTLDSLNAAIARGHGLLAGREGMPTPAERETVRQLVNQAELKREVIRRTLVTVDSV